jgi:hypothetical protein
MAAFRQSPPPVATSFSFSDVVIELVCVKFLANGTHSVWHLTCRSSFLLCVKLLSMANDIQATQIMYRDDTQYFAMPPGTTLRQRYRLDSEIGRGGMGIVYCATDLELMREVAVKVVSDAGSSDARQRLMREARAAASLNHPHIISVYDVGEAQGLPFFVMELVDGPSLAKARPSDLPRIVDIACQLCAALDHAHANRIVHRDRSSPDQHRDLSPSIFRMTTI